MKTGVRQLERDLAEAIKADHRPRRGDSAVIGRGNCMSCRFPWPCNPYRLAAIVTDTTIAGHHGCYVMPTGEWKCVKNCPHPTHDDDEAA